MLQFTHVLRKHQHGPGHQHVATNRLRSSARVAVNIRARGEQFGIIPPGMATGPGHGNHEAPHAHPFSRVHGEESLSSSSGASSGCQEWVLQGQ